MTTRRLWLAGALAVGWAAAGPAEAVVEIREYRFVPEVLTVKAGTRVRWVNLERRATHSVLFPGPDGLESERLMSGDSWERRFDRAGEFPYTCGPHPEMRGRIVVTP